MANFVQRDSAGTHRAALSRIVARKAAQSYHLDPNQKYPQRPSISYSRGDVIIMTMNQAPKRGVDRVDVRGKVDGVQLEAAEPAPPSDSAKPPAVSPPRGPVRR